VKIDLTRYLPSDVLSVENEETRELFWIELKEEDTSPQIAQKLRALADLLDKGQRLPPDTVPLSDYLKLQTLVTSQGIRLMEAEDRPGLAVALRDLLDYAEHGDRSGLGRSITEVKRDARLALKASQCNPYSSETAAKTEPGLSLDETRFRAALGMVGMMYPAEVFPPDGKSQDCLSAHMVRITLDNVWREYQKLKEAESACPQ
jgi:hypothetical protein